MLHTGPHIQPLSDDDIDATFSIITESVRAGDRGSIECLLDSLTILINTDTGGQGEFLDLQASLVQGPSLNLLFSRLVDDLDSVFQVYYTNKEGVSTDKEDSTMTLKEVIFQTMSSVACFSGCFSAAGDSAQASASSQPVSKLLLVGTHRDLVSEEDFRKKDQLLQQRIRNTPFYDKGIVEFASEGQLMLAVDNMNGGEDEIKGIRKLLESIIMKSFEKVEIPLAWLLLSLIIRGKKLRTMSLEECQKLAAKLRIKRKELQEALQFLHHRIGVILYYPEIEALKGMVICDLQVWG